MPRRYGTLTGFAYLPRPTMFGVSTVGGQPVTWLGGLTSGLVSTGGLGGRAISQKEHMRKRLLAATIGAAAIVGAAGIAETASAHGTTYWINYGEAIPRRAHRGDTVNVHGVPSRRICNELGGTYVLHFSARPLVLHRDCLGIDFQ
jgi:hypothetical protein